MSRAYDAGMALRRAFAFVVPVALTRGARHDVLLRAI